MKITFCFEIKIVNSISINTLQAGLEMFSSGTICTSTLHSDPGEDLASEGQMTSKDGQKSLGLLSSRTKMLREKTRLRNRHKMMRNIRFFLRRAHANSRDIAKC